MISAGDVDFQNGVSYTLTCVASMDSGINAETSLEFAVEWEDTLYSPNAEISYDPSTMTTQIRPFVRYTETVLTQVVEQRDELSGRNFFISNGVVLDNIDPATITRFGMVTMNTLEDVYYGKTCITIQDNGEVFNGYARYFTVKENTIYPEGISLAVYRREFDGSYTLLAEGIDNTKNTFVTDPHPALDYARYRIVATDDSTGAISYYDMPGFPIGEKAVIVQWNEDWSNFDVTNNDPLSQPSWSGSLLRLPYNIDVSDSYSADVSLVEYAGRRRPVTYYGTQLGESSTWNVAIDKEDEETLYGLRRLAVWPGDVYVREPSGTGYWANVSVSFSQKYNDLTIPVTLAIKRVEGGA
jgi:hypothetical protein